jgi:hypothetical protein
MRSTYKIVVGRHHLQGLGVDGMDLREIGWEGVGLDAPGL